MVVEISGRPVIVLHGRFPTYRDVHAGDAGPDVLELQHALGELGLSTGANSGVFNAATARALKTLYTRLGYRPPGERVSTIPTASPATGPGSGQSKMLLPASEVVYIPDTTAIVDDLQARVGKESKGTVMSLASGGLNVRALLSPEDRPLVSIGQSVQISSDQSGTTRSGRISAIGHYTSGTPGSPQITPAPGSNPAASGLTEGSGNSGHPLTVRPRKTLPPDWIGQDLKLTITTASTSGKVLAVPVSAVYGSADSATKVIKLLSNGSQKRIDVRTGASADGMVEVIAAGNALRPGDRVVVGR
ncbi:peptidoglycan-binding protein [Actinomadura sp. BRA 177]|uniref:peptidoglycan-binding protein n=1 Tax=Actinomadura sp. BRA 177 TaxID=2745202 RepID=UPI001595C8C6|nr:peptidoglycan-binding protein [Actinomadura sp. BRA 177]NVI87939.1 hypothetical protein [Actinomadura sp. BRA 177]